MDKVELKKLAYLSLISLPPSPKTSRHFCWMQWHIRRIHRHQAQRLRKASKEGTLTRETMREMLSEEKTEVKKLTFSTDIDPQIFPALLHAQTDAETIIKLLGHGRKKRQHLKIAN